MHHTLIAESQDSGHSASSEHLRCPTLTQVDRPPGCVKTQRGELIGSKPKPPVLTLVSDIRPPFVSDVRSCNGNTYRELCARYQDP